MVDVGGKTPTRRHARARATLRMAPSTAALVESGSGPKGEVISVARIAGIQAAKRASELIPLCHPLPLSHVDVAISVRENTVTVEAEAQTTAQTGVEMEAMTAATVAALTIYDMVKGVERGVAIDEVVLLEKTGGKEDWRR
jgi:cyclic pyranopterin monophosphate synthase